MSSEPEASPIKAAIEAIRAAVEALRSEAETAKAPTRAGPLVVVGRFYVSLVLILGVVSSASALIDRRGGAPSQSVSDLRLFLLIVVVAGLILSVGLIALLLARNPLLLFSPTELTEEAQLGLGSRTKEGSTKTEAPPPTGTKTTGPPTPSA